MQAVVADRCIVSGMTEVQIGDRLIQMPSPVYVIPGTVTVSKEDSTVRGKCLFPSSDPTIGQRVDHVNLSHLQFTLWNAAHIMAQEKGWGPLLALKVIEEAKRITPPDTEIDFLAKITRAERNGQGVLEGAAEAEFRLHGKLLATIHVERFVERKSE